MTIKEKLSMFFNRLLEQVEAIDNVKIKEQALLGLLQQTEQHLRDINELLETANNTTTKEEDIYNG